MKVKELGRGSAIIRPCASGWGRRLGTAFVVSGALGANACVVWKDDYDVIAAKYRNEAAAHAAAREDLAKRGEEVVALEQKVTRLEASLANSRERLDQNAESLAQAEYQYGIVEQQKQAATDLVAQLRAEQERLATHLQAYANDRAELNAERERLSQQLTSAEHRVQALAEAQKHAEQRLALVRDLSLRLRAEIDRKEAALVFDGDVVVVRLESASVFHKSNVSEAGKRLVAATGKALAESDASLNESSQLVLSQWEKGAKLRDSADRLGRVKQILVAQGIKGERFVGDKALDDYRARARALSQPLPPPPTQVEQEVEGQAAASAPEPVLEEVPAMKVSGAAVLIHLVPR